MVFFSKTDLHKRWTFRKSESYTRIHIIDQKHFCDKLEVAGFKYDKFFLKIEAKHT